MLKFLGASMSIDIGSDSIRLSIEERDDIWSERSVIALYKKTDGKEAVLATGLDALDMWERVPTTIDVIFPFAKGSIFDVEAGLKLLRHVFVEVQGRLLWISPKIRAAIHHSASDAEKARYCQLLLQSGAKKVSLVDRSFAAALGAGIPVDEACGYMIVNIGASTTEISVLALERVAHFSRVHVGGNMMNNAIISYLNKKYGVDTSFFEAERLKREHIQAVYKKDETQTIWVMGKDTNTGLPKRVEIPLWHISRSIGPTIRLIANAVQGVLDKLPPELSSDIMRTGIVLVGGGANLQGLSTAISIVTQHPVVVPDEPEDCVILGMWTSPVIA